MILIIDAALLLVVIYLWFTLEKKWMTIYVGFDPNNKALNYFLVDGEEDNIQVQAALDALPRWGGVVNLGAGTYNIDGVKLNRKNTRLQGVS